MDEFLEVSCLFVLGTQKHLVELFPGCFIGEFEHPAGQVAAVRQHMAQLQVLDGAGRKEFLEPLGFALEPQRRFVGRKQVLQILRQVPRLD